ncbi:MAG: PAS domain-containing protein [Chloroflexi bacterium]|nr:PAS domain-containing protein [Chloroflexota bacterium]
MDRVSRQQRKGTVEPAPQVIEPSLQLLQGILDYSPTLIYVKDMQGRYLLVNRQWQRLYSEAGEDALSLTDEEVFSEPSALALRRNDQAVIDAGAPITFEEATGTAGGDHHTYISAKFPLLDDHGRTIGVAGISSDITDRKVAEEALRASERRMSLIFEAVSDVLFLLAVEPNERYRFVAVNPAFLAVTGLAREQVVGKPADEVLPPDAYAFVLPKYLESIRENRRVSWEEVTDYPTGTLYGHVSVTPSVDDSGRCTHLVGTVHDITDLRRRELEIQKLNVELEDRVAERTGELEAANKELQTFVYSVSHDLKAPLRGIEGYSRLLLDEYADQLDETGEFYARTTHDAAREMSNLIEDLLEYSRMERGPAARGPVELRPLVEKLVAARHQEIADGTVTVTVGIPDETLSVDEAGLTQALRNLIDNALKFTRGVAEPRIEIGGGSTSGTFTIWVQDNGCGFDMRYHDRIFEIFQRLHRAEDYPGTGCGLAIVRKAVERMGGRVWAESVPDQGATFFLELRR